MENPPKNENTPNESEAIHERIDELRIKAIGRLGEKYNELMFDFAMKLKKRYPDCRKYRAFHQLIGSSPPEDALSGDFEGEDSIEAFLKSLMEEK
jgi:hypothetical protein